MNKNKIVSFVTALGIVASSFSFAVNTCAGEIKNLSQDTVNFYQEWKEKYLAQDNYVTDEDQYYIWYSEEKYSGNHQSVAVTVSEAHGYGMLIFAEMAEYDENAKNYFDGMYRFYKAHPSSIGSHLMSWQQCDNGTALIDGAEDGSMTGGACDSATDGDMDIAYALLLADSIWGSDGEIDYLSEAKAMIADIMQYDVNHEYWILTLGDWVSECDSSEIYYHATRTSDFIMYYLPVFAEVSGDENWLKVYDTTYDIMTEITAEYQNGILPDFVIRDDTGKFIPAGADFLESEYDGCYYYNACRTPWRIGMDYIINNNQNAKQFAENITSFIINNTNNDPWEIMAGYQLNGTAVEDYSDLCFTAPFLIASSCTDYTEWHDNLRDVIINYGEDVYYGDTIKLLCLISDDGGWVTPDIDNNKQDDFIMGDVNADNEFNLTDIIALQKWLHGNGKLANWQAGDFDFDSKINIYDLCLMKNALLK
ncbi:MAG: hypothetical protein K2G88_07480 [Oscillospiraceae bacterium]|nr:hypothetical protein [Oscillospiraceae bacterium]